MLVNDRHIEYLYVHAPVCCGCIAEGGRDLGRSRMRVLLEELHLWKVHAVSELIVRETIQIDSLMRSWRIFCPIGAIIGESERQ